MPKGVIAVSIFYGVPATFCLIDLLTSMYGQPWLRNAIYIGIILYLTALIVSPLVRRPAAWCVFIVLQVVLALLEIVMSAVCLARAEISPGFFYLSCVCIYGVIIWYFMWPETREFYGVKHGKEQPSE